MSGCDGGGGACSGGDGGGSFSAGDGGYASVAPGGVGALTHREPLSLEQIQARKEEKECGFAHRFERWEARKAKGQALWKSAKVKTVKHLLGRKV
jgi:hypothetical protein